MEWFAILIPILAAVALRTIFSAKVTWWECLLPMLPVFVIVPLIKLSAETAQVTDYERRGGWVVEARYFEDWDEWITQTCSRQVSCGKDCTTTESYDCSYREYHPPKWEIEDSNGHVVPISKETFEYFAVKFGNRRFVDLHRSYYWKDGDEYSSQWPRTEESFSPVSTEHRYVNRVQCTTGVFAYDKVDNPKEKGLYEFPKLENQLSDPPIIGNAPIEQDGYNHTSEASWNLEKENARLGRQKQVRMWVLLFHGKPLSVALEQESFWKGGNKNEVVVCIGFNGQDVDWVHSFCWSPDGNSSNDVMKAEIRLGIMSHSPFDIRRAVDIVIDRVKEKFVRKHFKEFDYLSVPVPGWAVIVIFVLTAISTGLLSWFSVVNEIDPDGKTVWTV